MPKIPKCNKCKEEVIDKEFAVKKSGKYFHSECYVVKEEVKCAYCSKKVEKSEAVKHSSKYYHDKCHAQFIKNRDDRAELIEYICELYNVKEPPMMVLKQIKDYIENHNFVYKGITLTLKYFYETLGNTMREGDGIGIVPYMYYKTREHHAKIRDVKKSLKDFNEETVLKEKIIYISPPSKKPNKKIIDISQL